MDSRKILLFGVAPALVLPFLGTILYFYVLADTGYANIVYTAFKIFSFAWVIGFLWLVDWKLPAMPVSKNLRKALSWGFLSGIAISGIGLVIFFSFEDYFRQFSPAMAEKVIQMGLTSKGAYIGFAVVISFLHSLLEEFYWRYFAFRGIIGTFSPTAAAITASIGFSLHHYLVLGAYFDPLLTFVLGTAVGIGGFIWCFMYMRSGTLIAPWISHVFVDAAIFFAGYVMLYT